MQFRWISGVDSISDGSAVFCPLEHIMFNPFFGVNFIDRSHGMWYLCQNRWIVNRHYLFLHHWENSLLVFNTHWSRAPIHASNGIIILIIFFSIIGRMSLGKHVGQGHSYFERTHCILDWYVINCYFNHHSPLGIEDNQLIFCSFLVPNQHPCFSGQQWGWIPYVWQGKFYI